jgi:2-amino-4-hydroxy-6-hydroxymethyldihydropteridine diphosphokinase
MSAGFSASSRSTVIRHAVFSPVNPKPHIHTACIGLGSNLGDSRRLLLDAWKFLGEHPEISTVRLSSPYRTEPVDMDSELWFVNAAGLLHTSLEPDELLTVLQEIEIRLGRIRLADHCGYQDRTLDLDLLLFDEQLLDTPRLTLPHPAMHKRAFVLIPLAEIAADLPHPGRKTSVAELLDSLKITESLTGVEPVKWLEDAGNYLK